jgi:hypothetical protein
MGLGSLQEYNWAYPKNIPPLHTTLSAYIHCVDSCGERIIQQANADINFSKSSMKQY